MRLPVAVAVLALLAFLPALLNDFVLYDDDLLITGSAPVRAGLTAEGVAWAFTTTEAANWMPLTRLSWLVDAEVYGIDPRGFHATSLVLHALAAGLLCLVLTRLTGAPRASALVAAVFATHPLNVEAVAWAAARRDVLAGLFAALTLVAYERAVRLGGAPRHALTAAALAAGLLSKVMLVTWPFVLLLLDAWPLRRIQSEGGRIDAARLRAAVVEKLPLFALAAAAGAVALATQSGAGALHSLESLSLPVRLANALAALAHYVSDLFWPAGLAVFYPHPGADVDGAAAAAGAGLLVGATAVAVWQWPRRPWIAVGWLWFVGMLVPVIGLLQVGQAARADRYLYLPMLGLCIALVFTARDLLPQARRRRAAAALGVLLVAALAARTWIQLGHWRDSERLFLHALHVTEGNHVAHINLGMLLTREGRLDDASAHLTAGLRITPRLPVGLGLLGDVRRAQGRSAEAIRLYRRALAIDPTAAERWREPLAELLEARGRADEAAEVRAGRGADGSLPSVP